MTANRHRDLKAACLWALATLLIVLVLDDAPIRIVMSAPLLLFVTGHAALRAVGPFGASLPERVVYAIGASIAICLAGGFFLNWIGHLTPRGWAFWLVAVTGLATFVAVRRHPDPAPVPATTGLANFRMWHAAALGVAILVSYSAYRLTVRDEARQRQFTYTELWMLPDAALAPGRLLVGVKSAELEPRIFDVEIRLDGATIALWRSIAVEPGATWTREMAVAPDLGHPHKAEALLYEPAGNALYRKVSTIIPGG